MVIYVAAMSASEPLTPAEATNHINKAIAAENCSVHVTGHCKDQMADRDITMGDVKHVLRRGYVYDPGVPATRPGFFKYRIEGTSPNSNGRTVRVVVIPSEGCDLKLVTVMWADEPG